MSGEIALDTSVAVRFLNGDVAVTDEDHLDDEGNGMAIVRSRNGIDAC